MKEIEYKDLSAGWVFCFNEKCSKKDSCLKFLTTKTIPANVTVGKVVLPTAYSETPCEHYQEKRIIKAAWGFEKMFYDVKKRDIRVIRDELMAILDSRTSYYRYASGEKHLTPEQQEQVKEVFRQHGYTENLEFDHYEEVWDL